jgi:uncharacterized membrane protein (UPF0127 family)
MKLDNTDYTLDIADTQRKMSLGLGGRDSLTEGTGMLFPYSKEGSQCFWMKNMRFSIDIVWLDAQKKVVNIERSLSPDTYPHTYCPEKAAQYVVEVNAGVTQRAGLKVGDVLQFDY